MGWASPRALARLPLHSLTQPMEWRLLRVDDDGPNALRRQLQVAVANLTRRCPAGFRWAGTGETLPQLILACGPEGVVEALRALKPLMMQASMTGLSVVCVDWTAPLVRALGEALPRACERLSLRNGGAPWEALAQLVGSLPWVRRLDLETLAVRPEDVVALACEVSLLRRSRQPQQQQLGGHNNNNTPRSELAEVVVRQPERPRGVGKAEHRLAWARAVEKVERLAAGPGVALRVEWDPEKDAA